MKNKDEEFIAIFKKYNKVAMKKFLLSNSKKPKPISPIYFMKEDNIKGGNNGQATVSTGTIN